MRARAIQIATVIATVLVPLGWSPTANATASAPPAGTVCTWGGTATAPTGTFTITPGLTNTPSASPSKFDVTGELAGDPDCQGTLTYAGQIDASGTCTVNT